MSTKIPTDRRAALHEKVDQGQTKHGEPVELPMGTYKPKSISQEIQEQIAIHTSKKPSGQ